ncbi:hypothetical protein DPMN_141109 [Dreissena polymorpha]|uniref:Uncharacterized protein n=1 Tax=Dreissena polymorpha TaxID=45954 RepID=A0A9D4G8S2_DREPO|nr:hypothetical protein DPMN_141109 [Dreissena polymorpha]
MDVIMVQNRYAAKRVNSMPTTSSMNMRQQTIPSTRMSQFLIQYAIRELVTWRQSIRKHCRLSVQ